MVETPTIFTPYHKNCHRTKKIISNPTIIEIFVDISDYDDDERENDKQEYYNLSDFQGYYWHITPLIDSLKINRISLNLKEKN